MLQKKYRLSAYLRLPQAQTVGNSLFLTKIAKNNLLHNRFGFVVSKKVDKRAVVRNRIKRILRSITEDKTGFGSYDILFVAKPGIVKSQRKDVEKEIDKIIGTLKKT